jgi:hypothetical protein
MLLKKRFVYVCKRRAESESRASDQGQSAKLLIHNNGCGAATRNFSETSIKHKMLRIEPRLAYINVVLLANRVLIFRFQLLAVYVLLVHNCGECRIGQYSPNLLRVYLQTSIILAYLSKNTGFWSFGVLRKSSQFHIFLNAQIGSNLKL